MIVKFPLRFASAWVLLAACGCVHTPPQLTLAHEIRVPKEWRGGGSDPFFQHLSDISRYISAYERGWRWCVVHYANDIEFRPACGDSFISGWAAATYGWPAGLEDARTHIEQLIRAYGKQRVSEYLSAFKDAELSDSSQFIDVDLSGE